MVSDLQFRVNSVYEVVVVAVVIIVVAYLGSRRRTDVNVTIEDKRADESAPSEPPENI